MPMVPSRSSTYSSTMRGSGTSLPSRAGIGRRHNGSFQGRTATSAPTIVVTCAGARAQMSESRKLAAILVSDVVGYSRLAGADEDRILARLRALRSDLIDPTIAVHNGRVIKRTGDGALVEFRSVVDAIRCAIEVQN